MKAEKIHVLIVEDHIALAENLFEFLGEEKYVIDFSRDGLTALHLLAMNRYDVIVLDVMLPAISGFELCKKIRQELKCSTPIIFMTAKDHISDLERGFIEGGDDYLIKPFDLRELQLRVDSLHRRNKHYQLNEVRADRVTFNPGTLTVNMPGHSALELSGIAARIFEALIKAYPNIVPYEQLQSQLWGDSEVDVNTLRTHVYTLRKTLQAGFGIPLIRTVHNRGYRLDPENGG